MANANQPSERTSQPKGTPDASTSQDAAILNEDRVIRDDGEQKRTEGGHVQQADAAYSSHRDDGTRTSRPDGRSGINDGKPNRRNDSGELAERG